MAHLAFLTIPFPGHVNPTLAVVNELVGRGHRVSYPITAGLADRVERAGATAVPYRTTTDSPKFTADLARYAETESFTAQDLTSVLRHTLHETVTVLPQLARAFADDPPNLVVYDPSSWVGRLLGLRWGVPTVHSVPTFAGNEHWSLANGYTTGRADLSAIGGAVARLLAMLRLDLSVAEFFAGETGQPTLLYLPRAFQYAGDTFPDNFRFVGPCIGDQSFHGTWQPPGDGRPVALVAFGTFHNEQRTLFRACVDALAKPPWQVVIAHGGGVEPADLGRLPGGVEMHDFVPQSDVLAHADVFINHGGMGTVMAGLRAGVPQVVVPQIAEHRAIADRIGELHLGRAIERSHVTPDALSAAVHSVVTDSVVRTSLLAMKRRIRAAGGAPAAADVIERQLAGTCLGASSGETR